MVNHGHTGEAMGSKDAPRFHTTASRRHGRHSIRALGQRWTHAQGRRAGLSETGEVLSLTVRNSVPGAGASGREVQCHRAANGLWSRPSTPRTPGASAAGRGERAKDRLFLAPAV